MKQLLGTFLIAALGIAMSACEPHSWEDETKKLFEEHGSHETGEHQEGHGEGQHSGKGAGHDDHEKDGHGDEKEGHKGDGHDKKAGE
jgi:hypothetical protein